MQRRIYLTIFFFSLFLSFFVIDGISISNPLCIILDKTSENPICMLLGEYLSSSGGTIEGNLNINGNISYNTIYAQLSDLVDQSFSAAGTEQPINLTTTDEIYGLTVSESNITIQTSGVYSLAAQPQVATGAGGAGKFHMWLEKHDTTQWLNVSNSNVELVLANNEENVIPLIATLRLNASEKIRIMGSVSDTAIKLDAQTPAGEPTIPSIIFTMFKLGE